MNIKLNFFNEYNLKIKKSIFIDCLNSFLKEVKNLNKKEINEKSFLNIILVDDTSIHKINKEYRKKDKPTDVISFAYLDSEYATNIPTNIGDIFISIDTAKKQAEDHKHSLNKEILVLTTHGLLHLFGFDHNTDEEENEMEFYAKKILENLAKHF